MKRFLSILAAGVASFTMLSGFASSAFAQAGSFGAGALILTNPNSTPASPKTVTLTSPVPGSPTYLAWQAAGFPNLTWSVPVPPLGNAQSGFVYSGPLTPSSGPYPTVHQMLYWIYPNQSDNTNGSAVSGGTAGTWNYATTVQLGLLTATTPIPGNVIPKSDPINPGNLIASLLKDDGTTFSINTNKITVDDATGNTYIAGGLNINNSNSFGQLDVLQTGGRDVLLGGGAATGSEIKFIDGGGQHMSIYNNSGSLKFANTSALSQTNTAGTVVMTLSSTGALTTAQGITATTGNIAASSGNVTASAQVNAGTSMSAGTTITAGTGITSTTGNIVASAGNISASGTLSSSTAGDSFTGNAATPILTVNNAGAGLAISATGGGISNTGTFTTAGGAVNINATTADAITLGEIGANGSSTTINVGNTGALTLNNIPTSTTTNKFLTTDGSGKVWTNSLTNFIQGANGVLVTYSGGVATAQLGANATDVTFGTDRYINLDGHNLNFTANGGVLTPVQIVGSATPSVNVTAATTITGTTAINGATSINVASGTNANTSINTTSGSGTVAIGNAASTLTMVGTTTVNSTGSDATTIGNTGSGGAVSINATNANAIALNGTTNVNTASGTNANTNINTTSGSGTVAMGNAASTLTLLGTTGINGTGSDATTIGNTGSGGAVSINATNANGIALSGSTTINNTGTGTTTIGSTGTGGAVSINATNANAIALNGTTNVNAASASNANTNINTTSGSGTVAIGNAASTVTVLGTTGINGTGSDATTIGNTGSGGAVSINATNANGIALSGSTTINNTGTGTTTIGSTATGGAVSINATNANAVAVNGTANINVASASNAGTNINTTSGSGTVAVGNAASTVTVLGTTGINGSGSDATTIGNTGSGGAVSINATNANAIALNGTTNINAASGSNANTNINTTSGSGTVAIGNAASTINALGTTNINTTVANATTIGEIGANASSITINVGNTGALTLNNIPSSTSTSNFLTTDGAGKVWTNALSNFIQGSNGVYVSVSGGVATAMLSPDNTSVTFGTDRYINLDGHNLNFTSNAGALTPVQIVGGATPVLNVNTTASMQQVNPQTDVTYDLGTTALRWRNVYVGPASMHVYATAGELGAGPLRNWSMGIITSAANGSLTFGEATGGSNLMTLSPTGSLTAVAINGTPIGGAVASTGNFTTLNASTSIATNGTVRIDNAGNLSNIGTISATGGATITNLGGGGQLIVQATNAGLLTSSNTLAADLNLGTHNITNAGTVTATTGTFTNLSGTTMTGDLAMGGHNISGGGTISGTAFSGGTGSFTTLTSSGASTVATAANLTNTFGNGGGNTSNTIGDNGTAATTTQNFFGQSTLAGATVNNNIGNIGNGTVTNNILGITNINTPSAGAALPNTNIGAAPGTGGTITIGNPTSTTQLNGTVTFTLAPVLPLATNQMFLGDGANHAAAVPMTQDASIVYSAGNGVVTVNSSNAATFAVVHNETVGGTLSASSAAAGTAELSVTNTSGAPGTQTGIQVTLGNTSTTNVGMNFNVSSAGTNKDITGTGGTWQVTSTGDATFNNGVSVASGAAANAANTIQWRNTNNGSLTTAALTGARTWTLPDITGTLAVLGGPGSFTTLTSTGNSTIATGAGATTNTFGTGAGNTVAVSNTIGSSFAGSLTTINGPVKLGALSTGILHADASGNLTSSAVGLASADVSGILPLANGGTNANLTASNGGIFYSTGTAGAILAGTATANQVLMSGSSSAPSWSTATYPAITTANQLLYSSAGNTVTGLATANGGILNTNGSGVPSITATPSLGKASTTTGTLSFYNASSANAGTLQVASLGQATTYTLPDPGAASATIALLGGPGSFTTLTSTGNSTLGTGTGALANSFGTGGNAANVINTIGSTGGGTSKTTINGAVALAALSTGIVHSDGSGNLTSTAVGLASADVSGILPLANGGTNANLTASNGGIFYSTGTAGAILAGTATANQILMSGSSSAPSWSTATYPATATTGDLMYASAGNTYGNLADVATGNVLISGGVGAVPSWGKVGLTTAVTGVLPIANGGTNASSMANTNGVNYFDGTRLVTTAAGTNGQLLLGVSAAAPAFATMGGDATITNAGLLTIATNAVSNGKFRQSAAVSVVGNATNATANVADITSGGADLVLRANGANTALAFGQVATGGIANSAITYAKIQNESNQTLLGNNSGGAAAPSEISLGSSLTWVDATHFNTIQDIRTSAAPTFAGATLTSPLNMSSQVINNVATPVSGTDAANKAYVDGQATATLNAAVILAPTASARNVVQPTAATVVPLTVEGFTAQSANLQNWSDATPTVLASISANGSFSTSGNISTSGGGTITSNGLLTASNGFTVSSGTITLPATSIANAALQGSGQITFTSSGLSLSASGAVALGGTANYDINVGHTNAWTAQQTFTNSASASAAAIVSNTFNSGASDIALSAGTTNAAGAAINVTSGNVRIAGLTASRPVVSDGSKNLVTGTIDLSSTNFVSNTLGVGNGGTGLTSYTIGDLLYASAATTLSSLSDVATGSALISGGVGAAPSWGKISLTGAVSGILPIANGGTNASSMANTNGVNYFDGTRLVTTGAATDGQVLLGATGAAPAFGTVGLGTTGTDVNWAVGTNSLTLNVPDASSTNRGVVTTGAQTFVGGKTFTNSASTAAALVASNTNNTASDVAVSISTTNAGAAAVSISSGQIIYSYHSVAGGGTLVPDATVFYINGGGATTLNVPTGTNGQVIYVTNASGSSTSGTLAIIPNGVTWGFVYSGAAWQHIQ